MLRPHSLFCAPLFIVVFVLVQAHCFPPAIAASTQTIPQTQTREETPELKHAIELYRRSKYEDALKILRKELDKDRRDDRVWYYLGLVLIQQKEIKAASKGFESALKWRPGSVEARVGLSYTLLLGNRLPEAIQEAQVVLSADPTIAEAYHILGVSLLRSHNYEAALKEAREANRLDPQFADAHLLRSEALVGIYSLVSLLKSSRPESTLTPEERAERARRISPLVEAAESLETFLRLSPSSSSDLWREQLATLQAFACYGDRRASGCEAVRQGDEVTTKPRVLSKPEPIYPAEARANRVRGSVILRCVLEADGTVKHVLILKSLPDGLTEASVRAARRIRFTPATLDGRAVSMIVQLEYHFNLF